MARADGESKQISTTASLIMTIAIGAAAAYLGVTMVGFGLYALGEDENLIGVGSVAVGGLLLTGILAVLVSQARAWLRVRK